MENQISESAKKLNGKELRNALPPAMPRKLPFLVAHLIKNVPYVCRPSVANGIFPSLAVHLNEVKFELIDGTEKEATFMSVNIAPQSSGKSAVNKPVEYILADIVERDKVNREREQEWKDSMNKKGANKEKPKRPDDLCVQVLVSDMTNAAFVQRMNDAKGKYLYTNLEEIELLRQLHTNGTKDVGKIICLCFDNGMYGQERVGTQSVTARVALRMAKRMLERCQREGDLTGDEVFQDLSYRAVTIAYLKAMVLYIAHGMQWSKEIEKFAEWSLDYDLWCKCHFFGDDMSDEKQKEHVEHKRGRQNMLELLPDTFTEKDVVEVRQRLGLDGDAKNMLRVWVYRKYILKDKETGEFRKN